MLPVLHIDEEALRPRIERAKLRSRRSFSLQDQQRPERAAAADASIVARLVRSHSAAHAEVSSRLGMRRERCSSCGEPVFLAEKLVVARVVYHRSCFRCARCRHQLTPGNYYETEDGQYCCEACPIDELPDQRSVDLEDQQPPQLTSQREPPDQQQQQQQQPSSGSPPSSSEAALLEAPLSDEEKLEQQLQQQQQQQRSGAAPNDEPEFEHMLKLINDRIDQLTSSGSSTADGDSSPDAAATRARPRSPVHSAPEPSSLVQPSPQHSTEKQQQPQQTSLRRSSSLRLVSEHTKDPQQHQQQQQQQHRRLSLGCRQTLSPPSPPQQQQQHRRRLFEQPSPAPAAEPEPPAVQTQQPRQHENDYPDDLNPFASDDEQQPAKPAASTNPFGSDDDDDELEDEDKELPPKPMARTKSKRRVLEAPRINLNPFWSDDEEPAESEEAESKSVPPVPRPRTLRHSGTLPPKSNLSLSSVHSSNTSIASSCSTLTPGGTYRKKKPAPPPPTAACLNAPPRSLELQSNSRSTSPRLTPRTRKSKPAPPPPPPIAASSPQQQQQQPSDRYSTSALPESETELARLRPEQSPAETTTTATVWQQSGDNDKLSKDEANRNTRSLSCTESSLLYPGQLDKSLEGKWKRKKGPAPPRPMPLRRKIKVMSMKDVKLELDQIEMQQQGLERQGVRLEQIIRDKCETGTASEEANLRLDVEELVLELFALVNEKNELFRRQAELMLLRRQQRLEEEHADIEYQVRCLITQPEATKTDFDKHREETLIQRLVEIVEKRNEIVECLEMDRRREIEEDRSIHREMDLYAARNKADNVNVTDESRRSTLKLKKGKLKEKVKEKKSKKSSKKDADKDVDETEAKLKRHTLRKWF